MNKYYLDVGILLHNYYENVENSKNINNIAAEHFEENLMNYDEFDEINDVNKTDEVKEIQETDILLKENYNSVMQFFNNRETTDTEVITEDNIYTSLKISDFVKEESIFKKKDILDEYLQKIDINYVSRIKVDMNIYKCTQCQLEMTLYPSDGLQICENCGNQQHVLIESDKPSFKDPPMEVCYFSYKRINHYNELLLYLQQLLVTVICHYIG